MKKALVLILALVFVVSMVGCTQATDPAAEPAETVEAAEEVVEEMVEEVEPITMVLGHFGAAGEPVSNAAETFKAELESISGGAIIVDVHGASELGNAPEMTEQTSIGAIQACLVSQGSLDKYDIRYALITAPYVYSGYEHAYAVVDGPFADWVSDGVLESKGLHNVGAWDYGFRNLTNSKHIVNTPEDVKGLIIRTPQEVQKVACFEALGAEVQQIAFSELITALKAKTVDGQENPISTIYNNKLWEANQWFVSLTRHTWESVNLTVSNDWWESLTDEQKGWVEQANAVASAAMREEVQSSEAEYIALLEEEGVTVTEVDLEPFKAAMQPAWDRVAEYEGSADDMAYFLEIVESVKP